MRGWDEFSKSVESARREGSVSRRRLDSLSFLNRGTCSRLDLYDWFRFFRGLESDRYEGLKICSGLFLVFSNVWEKGNEGVEGMEGK